MVRDRLGPLVAREGGAPEGWAERLVTYLELLRGRNRLVNLVSRKTVESALDRHVAPSLAALRLAPRGQHPRILDVGSGGGFPGIPLQILRPEARVDLLDATRKKCDFLEECVSGLGLLDTRVHWCRVEEPSETLLARSPFSRIVARAVGNDVLLARSARALLAESGEAWVFAAAGSDGGYDWADTDGSAVTALRRIS